MYIIFKALKDGDFGLAKTYWLFGVLGNFLLSLPGYLLIELVPIVIYTLFTLAYGVIVLLGIWNSASRYTGFKLWSILAKLAAIIGILYAIMTIFIMITLFQ
jgi:hypothetical protein